MSKLRTIQWCQFQAALLFVACLLVLNLALVPSWVHVYGTLVEAKMCTFTLESTHFIFNIYIFIYTHDSASAKFSTMV